MEYYSATKKNEIMLFVATWMDLEIVKLREVSKRRRMSYDILSMQNIKRNDTSEPNYKTETDSDLENRLMVAKREEIVRESGIDMYTLLYLKWIARDFSGGPVVKIPRFCCSSHGFHPGQGTKIPHAAQCG